MKKRILSILLTLCMVLSVVTPLVLAAENGQSAENADQHLYCKPGSRRAIPRKPESRYPWRRAKPIGFK